jgi:hypothetical protein
MKDLSWFNKTEREGWTVDMIQAQVWAFMVLPKLVNFSPVVLY